MTTVTCATRQLVDRLKAAGFTPEQAKAVVRAMGEAQEDLVTKTYLDHTLERTLAPLRTDLTILKWMMGVLLAGVMSLILKGFFWRRLLALNQARPPNSALRSACGAS